MSDTPIILRFRKPHGPFITADDYAFPPDEAQRYVAADLADIVGPTLDPASAVKTAVAGKTTGARTRKVNKA